MMMATTRTMTHRQNGLLAFSWLDNPLSLYQQFIQIERLFSAGGWEDVRHHDEPHRRREPESAQWHHSQEGVEERDEQATKRALRDEMTQKQVPWATGSPAPEAWQPRTFAWRAPQQTHGAGLFGGQNPNLRTGVIHGGRSWPPRGPDTRRRCRAAAGTQAGRCSSKKNC